MVGLPFKATALGLLAVLLACSGGGGSMQMGSAPSGLSYPSPHVYVVGHTIATLTPTVVGQVSSYAVTPALPSGFALSTTTGVISGTPTVLSNPTTYTITASNAYGSTTTKISIVVALALPSISYGSSYYAYTANVASQPITPMLVSSDAVSSVSITPALPTGLSFSDGIISGTPTAAAPATSYTVTASYSGGQSVSQFTIAVAAAPLLDLGHAADVVLIRTTPSDVMSLDSEGHWLLQAYVSGTTLASGDASPPPSSQNGRFVYPPVDLAGNTAIDPGAAGLEIRSAVDGLLSATVPGTFSWYQLATDGSYVTTGSSTGLTVWSLSGSALLFRPGDYSKAIAFSAPGSVRIAQGAAGQTVIETVSVPGGASSLSPPFQGQFQAWFGDGSQFITYLGTTLWIYSNAAVQEGVKNPISSSTGFGGLGNWFWSYNPVTIYQVGASAAPVFTASGVGVNQIPSGSTIGVVGTQLTVIDLSGAAPVSASYTIPVDAVDAYAANSAALWLVGNGHGVVFDGASIASQPRYLTLGSAWSIAGGSGYFSVALASGAIRYFTADTDAPAGSIAFSSSQLISSADGTVLAAAANSYDSEPDRTVNVYSLPTGSLISNWPSTVTSTPTQLLADLSADGSTLAFIYSSGCLGVAISALGVTPPSWCDTVSLPDVVRLSPDGTLVAASTQQQPGGTTNLYQNGAFVTTVPGWAVGWLDNGRLLTNQYVDATGAVLEYTSAQIVSPTGTLLATPPIPDAEALQVVTPDSIYYPGSSGESAPNIIVSLTTGDSVWASGDASRIVGIGRAGAVSGSQVIFASGNYVLAQPY